MQQMNNGRKPINIGGKSIEEFLASQLEQNEKAELDIERGKITIGLLKQLNNVSRLKLDTAKYELKRAEYERSVAKEIIADKAKQR